MRKNTIAAAVSAVIFTVAPLATLGYEQGDWIVRVGAVLVEPDESGSALFANGSAVAGTGLGVGNDVQLGLTVSYMLSDNIGIELLAATPFTHDVSAKGLGGLGVPDGTKIASVEHLPPTLSLQYYFMAAASALQPYAGIGVTYFLVLDESLTGGAEAALGASNLEVDDTIGLAFELGVDYRINDRWLINAAVWKIDVDTKVSLDSAIGRVTTDLDIDPWTYMVSVGYKF
ncbi:MAG: OmpW family outer membrane protein [Spongiibacteraceae bacterium]|jgi:outer membrane protein|nr:OmpW family outer membrane protein [Spongiibacteraceae bacterium]